MINILDKSVIFYTHTFIYNNLFDFNKYETIYRFII